MAISVNISFLSKKYYIFVFNNNKRNELHTECMDLV